MGHYLILLFLLFGFSANASFWIADGSVTNKKLAMPIIVKSDTNIFNSSAPTPINAATIVRTGRPVLITMESGIAGGFIAVERTTAATNTSGLFYINKNLTNIFAESLGVAGASGGLSISVPCSSISYIDDSVETGPATYSVLPAMPPPVNTIFRIYGCKTVVREL